MTRPAGTADAADRLPGGHWRNVVPLLDVRTRRRRNAQAAATDSSTTAARAAILTAHDLRAAQQAYVASGQGADFWFARTTAIQTDLKGRIAALRSQTSASAAVSAFEDALGRCRISSRWTDARGSTCAPERLLPASDLVFADGLDLTQKISAAIEQARAAEVAATDDTLAGDWPPAGVSPLSPPPPRRC